MKILKQKMKHYDEEMCIKAYQNKLISVIQGSKMRISNKTYS